MANTPSIKEKFIREIQLRLGAGMIDIELEDEHYETALTWTFDRYYQRSTNAVEQSFVFLEIQPNVQTYILPQEVKDVVTVYRRGWGGHHGGVQIDPFSLAFVNNLYMVQNPGGLGGSGPGTLATYDFAMQFQEQAGKMFGRDIQYTFDPVSKRIAFQRRFHAVETIMVHAYNFRPHEVLMSDPNARSWLRDYAVASCKLMLGEARSLFANLGGPQGGVTLNGEQMKSDAKEDMERLENELKNFVDTNQGMPFIIG